MNKKISILIVEDSEDDALLVIRQFKKENYDITSKRVETAYQMQTALEDASWDLVISDYNLPEFDAPSALTVLQKSGLDIPFIVVSGVIGEETAVALMRAGAHDYIMKGNLTRLIPAVNRELDEVQTRRAKQQADKEIKQAAEEWIRTFDSITDLVSIQDMDYQLVKVNQAYAQTVGMSPYALVGEHCYEMLHGTACPSEMCPHNQMLLTKKPITKETFEANLGIFLEVTISPIFNADGTLTGSVHIAKNITERKKAEQKLIESEERYRTAIEYSNDGIGLVKDGNHVYVNKKFLEMFGYDKPEDVIGKSTTLVVHPDCHEELYDYSQRRREEKGAPEQFEFKGIKKDGTEIFIDASVTKTVYQGEQVLFVFSRDITNRKIAEKELAGSAERLRKSLAGTLQAMAHTVEIRDPYTAGHEKRVSALARSIAQEMGLSNTVTDTIRMAASVHDVGKMSVPAEILSKPSRLLEIEMNLIKIHSQAGYDILKDSELPYPVAEIVLQHHERLDGSGYPQGLKGDEILLEAQIISIADVVEAMASHRPYRAALGINIALEEIEKDKGILYNVGAVRACLHLFRDKGFKFE